MAQFSIIVRVRFAWWVRPYLCALQLFGFMMGLQPDAEKAADLVSRRGTKFDISPVTRTED